MRISREERFDRHVERVTESGCWLWLGGGDGRGYGRFNLARGNSIAAHRFSFERENGPVPLTLQVCHRCDVPACVNPSHLFTGSAKENAADKVKKGRQARGERQGSSRLSAAAVLEIFASDLSYQRLGDLYGVSAQTVYLIKHRRVWRHITESAHAHSSP